MCVFWILRFCFTFYVYVDKYATTQSKPVNIISISCWKMLGNNLTSNGNLLQLYRPLCFNCYHFLKFSIYYNLQLLDWQINFWKNSFPISFRKNYSRDDNRYVWCRRHLFTPVNKICAYTNIISFIFIYTVRSATKNNRLVR